MGEVEEGKGVNMAFGSKTFIVHELDEKEIAQAREFGRGMCSYCPQPVAYHISWTSASENNHEVAFVCKAHGEEISNGLTNAIKHVMKTSSH